MSSPTRTNFTITNTGTGVLRIGTPSVTVPSDQAGLGNPFTVTGCASAALTAGQTCAMVVSAHVVTNDASKARCTSLPTRAIAAWPSR
jgi:hypothetical protein